MKPESRVVLIEDEPEYIQDVVKAFSESEYQLTQVLTTLEEALEGVERFNSKDPHSIGCNVVILDANLDNQRLERTGSDALSIFRKMQRLNLFSPNGRHGIKLIGFSKSPMWEWGVKVHADPGKFAPDRLPTVVKWLDPDAPWQKRN